MFLFSQTVVCQNNTSISYPDVFQNTVTNFKYFQNPSHLTDSLRYSFGTLYKSRFGVLNEVSTLHAQIGCRLKQTQNLTQYIRFWLNNEREGPYISSPQTKLNYAIKIKLAPKISLSSGLVMGYLGKYFTAPSGSGTFHMPDGAIGISCKVHNFQVGFAVDQIFNLKKKLYSSPVWFKRYYQYFLNYELNINPFWKSHTSIWYIKRNTNLSQLYISQIISYQQLFDFGVTYKPTIGSSYFVALNIPLGVQKISTSLCYNTNMFGKMSPINNTFELGLTYQGF